MEMQSVIDWIAGTSFSAMVSGTWWVIPTIQSIHICGIAVVVGSALVSELRLAGLVATDESPAAVVRRYLPWMWSALLVMLLTGLVLIAGEPERSLKNQVFWLKMLLVIAGFALSLLFRKPMLDIDNPRGTSAWRIKPVAWVALTIWVAVIFSGRWIAYT